MQSTANAKQFAPLPLVHIRLWTGVGEVNYFLQLNMEPAGNPKIKVLNIFFFIFLGVHCGNVYLGLQTVKTPLSR
jgi:hypothetical protein